MFFNTNFTGAGFDCSTPENANSDFNGYPYEVVNGAPLSSSAQVSGLELDPTLAGLDTAEIEDWWLAPRSDCAASQYTGSTVLEYSCNEFAGVYAFQTGNNTDDAHGFNVLEQQPMYEPEQAGPSVAGPSTAPFPLSAGQSPSRQPATFTGPAHTSSPVPTLWWGPFPPPSPSYAFAGNSWSGEYDQPLAGPSTGGQWPYPTTSVGKGKARAMDHLSLTYQLPTDYTMWQHQPSYMPQDYDAGLTPQMGTGVPNVNLSAQVAPSTGPERSVRSAKGKGKEMDKGKGKHKRIPKKDLPPGIDWPNTCNRFCAEMAKICLNKPTGEVITPEMAYARAMEFIKEDLYHSPLVGEHLGERPSRDLEQYLADILSELRPWKRGQTKGIQYTLERVAQELENELVVVNDDFALQGGHSNEVDPEELDTSEKGVARRFKEQARRASIRRSLKRMASFFELPVPGYLWSRPQVLFFAITYLVFGAGVFSDGGGFFTPKPQL